MPQFLCILKPCRPTLVEDITPDEQRIVEEHVAYLQSRRDAGLLALAGRTEGAEMGIVVFSAGDETKAREFMRSDPAVRAGVMTATLYPFRLAIWGTGLD